MTLIEEQSSHQEKSLFDHIYIDHIRLSHYYSQLSEIGLISGSKRIGKKIQKDQTKGHISAAVAKAEYSGETTSEDGYEHQIDTSYSRPLETLAKLQEEGFVHNGLSGARIGNLILFKGSLSLNNTKLVRDIYKEVASVEMRKRASVIPPKEKQSFLKTQEQEIQSIDGVLSKLPFMLQGTVSCQNESCWFTLEQSCMLVSQDDFVFKHGMKVQGEWYIFGILDALPDVEEPAEAFPENDFQAAIHGIQELLKLQFGRGPLRFGVTPIMIFRQIHQSQLPEYMFETE